MRDVAALLVDAVHQDQHLLKRHSNCQHLGMSFVNILVCLGSPSVKGVQRLKCAFATAGLRPEQATHGMRCCTHGLYCTLLSAMLSPHSRHAVPPPAVQAVVDPGVLARPAAVQVAVLPAVMGWCCLIWRASSWRCILSREREFYTECLMSKPRAVVSKPIMSK